jgi:hypothetical protein
MKNIMPVIMGFVLANDGSTVEIRSNAEQLWIHASRLINDNIMPAKGVRICEPINSFSMGLVEGQMEVIESFLVFQKQFFRVYE